MNASLIVFALNATAAVICLGVAFLEPFTGNSVVLLGFGLINIALGAANFSFGWRK